MVERMGLLGTEREESSSVEEVFSVLGLRECSRS